jgi:hypothetical protein
MPRQRHVLLASRNLAPLSKEEVRRATNSFLGLDKNVSVRYDEGKHTVFRVDYDESGEYGEIVFGPDIYPGTSVTDPNAMLSVDAAAAHELSHYYRWKDKAALDGLALKHIDEALTSLHAILRYDRQLNETDKRQLVADAMQRLQHYVNELPNSRS